MTKILALLSTAVFCAGLAQASSITLESVNGINDGNYYTGFETLQSGSTTFPALCVDFNNFIDIGQTWDADILPLPTGPSPVDKDWRMEVWLYSQLLGQSDPQTVIDIQYAAWGVFSANAPSDPGSQTWLTAASQAAASPMNVTGFEMIQPSGSSGQVFLAESQTPEPPTLALIGIGLLLCGIGRLRKGCRPYLRRAECTG